MADKPEKFWQNVAPYLRKHLGVDRPTLEEAQEAFDAAEDEPLTQADLDSIIDFAKGKNVGPAAKHRGLRKWLEGLDVSQMQNYLIPVLNRNATEEDPEVDALMSELREKTLEEYDQNNEQKTSIPSDKEKREGCS